MIVAMRLLTHLREEKIDDGAFAARVGDCTGHAVKKWKYGERVPDARTIARIDQVTAGKVTLADWVEQEAERRAKRQVPEAPPRVPVGPEPAETSEFADEVPVTIGCPRNEGLRVGTTGSQSR